MAKYQIFKTWWNLDHWIIWNTAFRAEASSRNIIVNLDIFFTNKELIDYSWSNVCIIPLLDSFAKILHTCTRTGLPSYNQIISII